MLLGLCLWVGVHLFPSVAAESRARLIGWLGTGFYKGLFALCIVLSLVMMVTGWRSFRPVDLYQLPEVTTYITYLCLLLTFILFVAAKTRNSIKQYLRHPQLTGVILWSIGHLLVNGDSRSLILFGGIGIWAILEMVMINRREGEWIKPEPVVLKQDMIVLCGGIFLFIVIWWLHPYLSGISLGGT